MEIKIDTADLFRRVVDFYLNQGKEDETMNEKEREAITASIVKASSTGVVQAMLEELHQKDEVIESLKDKVDSETEYRNSMYEKNQRLQKELLRYQTQLDRAKQTISMMKDDSADEKKK